MEATYFSEYMLPVHKSKLHRIQEVGIFTINSAGTSNAIETTFVSSYVSPSKDSGAGNVRFISVAALFVFQSIKINYITCGTRLKLGSTVSYFTVALSSVWALANVPLHERTINIDNGKHS
jgi:hypothetical protein